MPVAALAAVVGAAAAVAGTAASISNASKARKASRKQSNFERQIAQNRSTKERRDAIRAARLTSGVIEQNAANQGSSSTSSFLGGLGSITSQLNSNLSFLDTQKALSDQASIQAGNVNSAQSKAANWSAVAGLGVTVFKAAGGAGAFSKKGS